MFDTLSQRLTAAIERLSGKGRLTEQNIADAVRQIRVALLEADVALPVVKGLIERVRARALGLEVARSVNPGQAFVKIVHDEIVTVLGGGPSEIAHKRPSVVLLVGLQGTGKTTTAAKLARFLPQRFGGGQVWLASTDVYRPAAIAQLAQLARAVGAEWHETSEQDPVAIARSALAAVERAGARWLIVDTAGRLHIDAALMAELEALHDVLAPTETLLVLDAMAGQDAVHSAQAFQESLPLSGVVLSKADGDARGGAALSVREVTGLAIKAVGVGEKPEALEPFVPERMASRILGMGDVVGLVEQVSSQVDAAALADTAAKVKRGGSLDLADLQAQLRQLVDMGGLGALLAKLPGGGATATPQGFDERQLKRQIGLIDSMTPRERRHPEIINGSRKRRIAAGAGVSVQELSRLLKQHRQMAKAMKQLGRGNLARRLAGLGLGALGPRGKPGLR